MQTNFTEQRNKSQACFRNSEFAIISFRCNKSQEKNKRQLFKKQINCSSSQNLNFLQKRIQKKKEIKRTKFFNYQQPLEKLESFAKIQDTYMQGCSSTKKTRQINIFNSLTKNNENQRQIFFKSKREAKFFDLFIGQNKKLKINRRMNNNNYPKQDEDDYDTDEEILTKSVEKIISLLQKEIQKRNSNFKFNQFSFLE